MFPVEQMEALKTKSIIANLDKISDNWRIPLLAFRYDALRLSDYVLFCKNS